MSVLAPSPPSGETSVEFDPADPSRCLALWRSTAGSVPASVLYVENGSGIVAMFPPLAAWDDLGRSRDFDLVYPLRIGAAASLRLTAPWRAFAVSDFLCHVFDPSRSASPREVIETMIECIEALGGGLPQRLRASALVPSDLQA